MAIVIGEFGFFGEPIDSSFKFLTVWWFGGLGDGLEFHFDFWGEGVWFGFRSFWCCHGSRCTLGLSISIEYMTIPYY